MVSLRGFASAAIPIVIASLPTTGVFAQSGAGYSAFVEQCRRMGGTHVPGPGYGRCDPGSQQPSGPQLDPRLFLVGISAQVGGDVTFVYPNGERVRATSQTPIVLGARVLTGPNARVIFMLLDETVFTVGPGSDMVIDRFVYDPASANVSLRVATGAFRFVSGRVARTQVRHITISTPIATIGIRGTDLEINIDPGGSGTVALHEGEIEVEEYDTGRPFTMRAGQTLRWENFRIVGVH